MIRQRTPRLWRNVALAWWYWWDGKPGGYWLKWLLIAPLHWFALRYDIRRDDGEWENLC